jgi:phosphoglycerate dehydrogenase-like enzyme
MKPIPILSTLSFTEAQLDKLRAISPRLRVTQTPCRSSGEVAAALARDTEVLYTFHAPPDPADFPALKWVQLHTAGADHLLGTPLMRSDVLITTVSGIHAPQIAEYVLASMLAFRYKLPAMLRYQARAEWPQGRWDIFAGRELRGQTVGIVGYGSIGREVARLARAFAMRVLVSKRNADDLEESGYSLEGVGDPTGDLVDGAYGPGRLPELLGQCHFVVLAAPLTPETRGLIGEEALRAMRPDAYLVNIARGELMDEAALVRALREGWIAGAGLDVFEEEPLPSGSPLWGLDNVILSPHVAGFSLSYDERATDLFAQNLARYLAGEPLLNRVDKGRGY